MKERVFISSWHMRGAVAGVSGLSLYEFDLENGELSLIESLDNTEGLNVTCVDNSRNVLYALNESADLPSLRSGGGGSVCAFQLNPETGQSVQISCKPTCCPNPAYLSLDKTGKYLIVVNHATHSYVTKVGKDESGRYCPVVEFDDSLIDLFSLNADGSIGEILDVVQHFGDGPRPKQKNAHPHSVKMSPSGKLFAVCDKGNDGVFMYKIDSTENKLVSCGLPHMTRPGTMPRYCAFHPTLPFFYHNSEGTTEIFAYRYDEEGQLFPLSSFSVFAKDHVCQPGMKYEQQGLCMHPSGRFLYDIVRGSEMVAVYQIDQEDGSLKLIQNEPVGHEWPRGAALSSDGKYLVVTCLTGNKVVVFSIDEDGILHKKNEYDHPIAAYAEFWTT